LSLVTQAQSKWPLSCDVSISKTYDGDLKSILNIYIKINEILIISPLIPFHRYKAVVLMGSRGVGSLLEDRQNLAAVRLPVAKDVGVALSH
jgi:hypothetical protein